MLTKGAPSRKIIGHRREIPLAGGAGAWDGPCLQKKDGRRVTKFWLTRLPCRYKTSLNLCLTISVAIVRLCPALRILRALRVLRSLGILRSLWSLLTRLGHIFGSRVPC